MKDARMKVVLARTGARVIMLLLAMLFLSAIAEAQFVPKFAVSTPRPMLLTAAAAPAPVGHSATLAWTASTDAAANPSLTYNVYRAAGVCPASQSGFTKIASAVAAVTFTDTTPVIGQSCYNVTAFLNAAESVPSNNATATILPAGPTALQNTGTS